MAFYYGDGVEQSYENAFDWMLKAAENGNDEAKEVVSFMYGNGIGTEKDALKAALWKLR